MTMRKLRRKAKTKGQKSEGDVIFSNPSGLKMKAAASQLFDPSALLVQVACR
jgi:hypothetical protein